MNENILVILRIGKTGEKIVGLNFVDKYGKILIPDAFIRVNGETFKVSSCETVISTDYMGRIEDCHYEIEVERV